MFACRTTTVAHIMTKGPMCVTADTSAQDALNLMVSRGFRHLVNTLGMECKSLLASVLISTCLTQKACL